MSAAVGAMSGADAAAGVIRVALVDDQELLRAGLRVIIETQRDLRVVAEAVDGREAVDVLATVSADVVLMDVRMPRMDGLEATRLLLARPDPPKVVILTTYDLDEYLMPAVQAGAAGFLLKDARPEDLFEAIRAVHLGNSVVAAAPTRRLLAHIATAAAMAGEPAMGRDAALRRLEPLTAREREVFVLVGEGLSNTEIAQRLFLGETTVKTHVGRILTKTESRDRIQAVVLAHRAGLVAAD